VEHRYIGAMMARNDGNVVAVTKPRDLAHELYVCLLTEHKEYQRREGGEARRLECREPFLLDRMSYPSLLVAALVALSASEAEKAKPTPVAAIPVEMTKPPR